MSQQHLCFYSTRSRYCSEFLEALAASPYAREFRFVCVDAPPGGTRPALPPYVRAVPTLMIAGESEPRVDGRVMDWLTDRRLREREAVAAPGLGARMGTTASVPAPGGARPAGGAGAAAAADLGGPAAFTTDMMGFGDEGFSFIGEDVAGEKGSTNRMLGNMASLNDLHMLAVPDSRVTTSFTIMGGGAAAPSSSGPKQSEKSKALDDAYTRMMAEREASLPGPKVPANPFGGGR